MKKLIYSLGIVLILSLISTACQKQNDLAEDQQENPASNPYSESVVRICHNTGSSYSVIEISDDAWPGHEAHGDILYEEFPEVAVYKWAYGFGDSIVMQTMHIIEVTGTTFSGYGINNVDNREWTLVDGTIYEDESFSFTIDYDNSNEYLECEGAFICGEGIVGDFGVDGSITGFFYGQYSDEDGLIEINP